MSLHDDHPDALKALELALAKLDKQFGKNTVFYGDTLPEKVDIIPTQCFVLDNALGVGGLPKGRICEVFGPEAIGKTLIALSCAASVQREGGLVAYVDAECALDPSWAAILGVDVDKMLISQPESGEIALEIVETLVKTRAIDLIVIDSVAALTPQAVIDKGMDESTISELARLMSKALGKLVEPTYKANTCLLFLNQIREKIGPMTHGGTQASGGRALRFYSAIRIELKRLGDEKDSSGNSIGTKVKAVVLKNKVARPAKSVEYKVLHGIGFNTNEQIIEEATKFGLVNKSGAWYSNIDDKKNFAQGLANAAQYLNDNPEFKEELMNNLRKCYEAAS